MKSIAIPLPAHIVLVLLFFVGGWVAPRPSATTTQPAAATTPPPSVVESPGLEITPEQTQQALAIQAKYLKQENELLRKKIELLEAQVDEMIEALKGPSQAVDPNKV